VGHYGGIKADAAPQHSGCGAAGGGGGVAWTQKKVFNQNVFRSVLEPEKSMF